MSTTKDERAVIYVPGGPEADRWVRVCTDYCARRGYKIVAVSGVPADRWIELRTMAWEDVYDVLVVGRHDHLPATRRPRIEVVAEDTPARDGRPNRRPRVIRRPTSR